MESVYTCFSCNITTTKKYDIIKHNQTGKHFAKLEEFEKKQKEDAELKRKQLDEIQRRKIEDEEVKNLKFQQLEELKRLKLEKEEEKRKQFDEAERIKLEESNIFCYFCGLKFIDIPKLFIHLNECDKNIAIHSRTNEITKLSTELQDVKNEYKLLIEIKNNEIQEQKTK